MPRRKGKAGWLAPKASTTARGYGHVHQQERKRWDRLVQTGTVPCVRCGYLIPAGSRWHLDHDDDKTHYRGPAHARCNLLAASKRANEIKAALNPPRRQSRVW
jgi:hypothetical protein